MTPSNPHGRRRLRRVWLSVKAAAAGLVFCVTAFGALSEASAQTSAITPLPSPWDFAIGGKITSDYNFRGISQSARQPNLQLYGELRYDWLYAGAWAYTTRLPSRPLAEIDLYVGIRPKVGPVTLDLGAMYYLYPNERQFQFPAGTIWTPSDTDFWEAYFRPRWEVNSTLTIGANTAYAPNWLRSGASGTIATAVATVSLPNNFSISGEVGRYWFGRNLPIYGGIKLPDFTLWNVGLSYTWNQLTFDVRYHGTDASPERCFLLTSDQRGVTTGSGRSNWCGHAFIASVSFDTTWNTFKPIR
ncbi:MAG: TorF family putative porin [Alphaproteobacteria bacterium]